MSEWRYRPVPAGIANTVTGLLQRDKKTSVFAHCVALALEPIPDVALRRTRATRANHSTMRLSNIACASSRPLKNTDDIWVFIASAFSGQHAARRARAARAIAKVAATVR
jgi:hypothetical protein